MRKLLPTAGLSSKQSLPFYFFVIGAFLIIICRCIFADGMFMDGLFYATIAKNLSNGIGTFWHPHFTATCFPDFHEHPPLAIGLQSLFFSIMGDSRFVERIYSLITVAAVGFIIIKIWEIINNNSGKAWLPLLFWISIPVVGWACCNNAIENTLCIFTSLSVLFYLKSFNSKRFLYIFLCGFMLVPAFLTKGFVAFFPWTFPFFFWLFSAKHSFAKMAADTLIIFASTIIPLVILFAFIPAAKDYLFSYIHDKIIIIPVIEKSVDNRFYIVERLFFEHLPAFCLMLTFITIGWLTKFSFHKLKSNYKNALMFALFGLTGVLPVMVSMKQSGFYILATLPFFAIALGAFIKPLINFLLNKINYRSAGFLMFKNTAFGILCVGIVLCIFFSGSFGRDKNKIGDTYLVLSKVPANSTISIMPCKWHDWSLHAYYARYGNVSLDPDLNHEHEYLLYNECGADTILNKYEKIPLPTKEYTLFRKRPGKN